MQATWQLEDVPGGTVISIGADAACDWQIRAAGVAPHALDLMLLGGTVFAKCPADCNVMLEGRSLSGAWSEVSHAARIHLGLAQLEVTLGVRTSAFEHLPEALDPPLRAQPLDRETLDRALLHGSGDRDLRVNTADASNEQKQDLENEPQRPSMAPRTSLFDRSPSLLDDSEEALSQRTVVAYTLAALATACAYAGWLAILDAI